MCGRFFGGGLPEWDELPEPMRCDEVRRYYRLLAQKRGQLAIKRAFDIYASALLLAALSPVMAAAAVAVCAGSKGGALFRQRRVTQGGRVFEILKLRTMYKAGTVGAGALVTAGGDARITRVGKVLRRLRIDELPQLINVLAGDMTLVGTRPEVERFVKEYTPEMLATLLLPAGMTSAASVRFRNEEELLKGSENPEREYAGRLLPEKMRLNLNYLRRFSLITDAEIIVETIAAAARLAADGLKLKERKKRYASSRL
mgnify:CR=1 FL=1